MRLQQAALISYWEKNPLSTVVDLMSWHIHYFAFLNVFQTCPFLLGILVCCWGNCTAEPTQRYKKSKQRATNAHTWKRAHLKVFGGNIFRRIESRWCSLLHDLQQMSSSSSICAFYMPVETTPRCCSSFFPTGFSAQSLSSSRRSS
jgi:hypothetical protein